MNKKLINERSGELKQQQGQLDVFTVQRKGYKVGIDMHKKVKNQEHDMRITPLFNELNKN